MGCDIHWYVERQLGDGSWEECGSDFDDRDYDLFTALAGVRDRGSVPRISGPRGMPLDASAHVRKACEGWEPDGHSHSWHTLATLLAYDWDGNDLAYFRRVLDEMAKQGPPDRVRAVFWFDN